MNLLRLLLSYVKCEKVNSIDFLPFFIFRSYQENCIYLLSSRIHKQKMNIPVVY